MRIISKRKVSLNFGTMIGIQMLALQMMHHLPRIWLIRGAYSGRNEDEEPNESAKKFHELLKDAQQALCPGSKLTKISFLVRLFQLKCMGGWSNQSTGKHLNLYRMRSHQDILSQTALRKHGSLYTSLDSHTLKSMLVLMTVCYFVGHMKIWTRVQHAVRVDGRRKT